MTDAEKAAILLHKPHPYEAQGFPRDEWIDTFRAVFTQTDAGPRCLAFLASHWHFFERSLATEEYRVQRQCFLDLLICCGIVAPDTCDQMMQMLVAPKYTPQTRGRRLLNWIWGLRRIRTERMT